MGPLRRCRTVRLGQHQGPTSLYHFTARYNNPDLGNFTTRSRVSVTSDVVGERELARGQQLDVREIAVFGTNAKLPDQAVAAKWPSPPTPPTRLTTPCPAAPARSAEPPSCPTAPRSPAPRATAPDRPARCPGSPSPGTCDG